MASHIRFRVVHSFSRPLDWALAVCQCRDARTDTASEGPKAFAGGLRMFNVFRADIRPVGTCYRTVET